RTLHADVPFALTIRELMDSNPVDSRSLVRARIRRVVAYSSKLGRRRGVADDADLFTVLPTGRPTSIPTRQTGLAAGIDRDRGGLGTWAWGCAGRGFGRVCSASSPSAPLPSTKAALHLSARWPATSIHGELVARDG